MITCTYSTGRDYGAAQVLTITFNPGEDPCADVPVFFVDSARGISGRVVLMGFNVDDTQTDAAIGAAVLREYDAGRYVEI